MMMAIWRGIQAITKTIIRLSIVAARQHLIMILTTMIGHTINLEGIKIKATLPHMAMILGTTTPIMIEMVI